MKNIFIILFVLSVAYSSAQTKIQHTTNSSNISGNSTYLNAEGLNGNPRAIIIIVKYTLTTEGTYPHAVGVWYTGSKWAIFNEDKTSMPPGITFSIAWKNPDATAFYQKSSVSNLFNGKMSLNQSTLQNNPGARIYVTQNWNPGVKAGVYNPEDIMVTYDNTRRIWEVKNTNESDIPVGAAFNILVLNPGDPSLNGSTIKAEAIINKNKTIVPAIKTPTDIPTLADGKTYTDTRLNHLLTVGNEEEIKQYIQSLPFEKQFIIQTESEYAIHAYYRKGGGTHTTDNDGDGDNNVSARNGGDCNDNNPFVSSLVHEKCKGVIVRDFPGLRVVWINALCDEDCDVVTVGNIKGQEWKDSDEDRDGAVNCNCKNFTTRDIPLEPQFVSRWSHISYSAVKGANKMNYKFVVSGADCDDNNPNIGKEGQVCIAPNKVGMCVGGVWKTFECKKCVTQPNGSGLVVEW